LACLVVALRAARAARRAAARILAVGAAAAAPARCFAVLPAGAGGAALGLEHRVGAAAAVGTNRSPVGGVGPGDAAAERRVRDGAPAEETRGANGASFSAARGVLAGPTPRVRGRAFGAVVTRRAGGERRDLRGAVGACWAYCRIPGAPWAVSACRTGREYSTARAAEVAPRAGGRFNGTTQAVRATRAGGCFSGLGAAVVATWAGGLVAAACRAEGAGRTDRIDRETNLAEGSPGALRSFGCATRAIVALLSIGQKKSRIDVSRRIEKKLKKKN